MSDRQLSFSEGAWEQVENLQKRLGARNKTRLVEHGLAILSTVESLLQEQEVVDVKFRRQNGKTTIVMEIPTNAVCPKHFPKEIQTIKTELEFD